MLALLLCGCAAFSPADVPPPPQPRAAAPVTYAGATPARLPVVAAQPSLQAAAPMPDYSRHYDSNPYAPPSSSTVLSSDPLVIPSAPSIYLAPEPARAAPRLLAANSPRVLQGEPGPALALDFKPNPAWRRAVIPPDSNAATVGRVPPPAAMPGFTIGAGDTVQIDVLGRPELLARSNVSGDGRITAALLGPVNVAGMTPAQAAEKLSAAYRDGQYLVLPQVTVTLIEYQSQQLTVLGEVRTPGRFPMRTRLSVLDGIALSGGITDTGASTAYLLRPEDSVVTRYEIDLDALIQSGAGQQYFELIAGDTLVVPKAQLFYIYGEVKSPNAYKLKPGMTVIQALSLAGGLTDKGSDRRIDIRRQSNSRLASVSASLNDTLQADDVVYVRERLF